MDKIQGSHGEEAGQTDADEAHPVRRLGDIAPWRRIIVALAGPSGNILLAVVLAWIVYWAPDTGASGANTTVGSVDETSAAYAAGLRAGDSVRSVNHNRIHNWNEFLIECHLNGDPSNGLAVVVQRDTNALMLNLPVVRDPEAGFVRIEGIGPLVPCIVGDVITNSPAARAGVQPKDIILTLDGALVASPEALIAQVDAHGPRPLALEVERGGRRLILDVTPDFHADLGRHLMGIAFAGRTGPTDQWMQYRQPWRQLKNDALSVVRILRALFAPRAKGEARRAAGSLSGPLVIFVLLWYQVQTGLIVALAFLRFLCVNLAMLNLLPLPVLDGGHIVFALYEMITRRKPNATFVTWVSNAFAILLIGLMVLLMFRDARSLNRIFGRHRTDEQRVHAADAAAPTNADGPAPATGNRMEDNP